MPPGPGRRQVCAALAAGLLLPGMAACTRAPGLPLRVGINAWVGYDPLALARDQGLLDTRRVQVVDLSSSSEAMRYLRNGLIDAGALTLDEVLTLVDEGVDLRVVALLSESAGADAVMVHPSIRQVADLRGKVVALEQSTVGGLVLRRMLASAGMSLRDVVVLNREAAQHLPTLRSGRAVAVVSFDPLASVIEQAGFVRLFDSSAMRGVIVDTLAVRAQVLGHRFDDVAEMVAGWNRALRLFAGEPDEVARIMGPTSELAVPDYLRVLGRLKFFEPGHSLAELSGSPPRLAASSADLVSTLREMDRIGAPPDWAQLVAPAPAAAAQKLTGGAP